MAAKDYTELSEQLKTFETFVARRFDEISMEVNATSQQLDMTEETIAGRFSDIVGVLHSISHTGQDGVMTAHNTGVELENVVNMTEDAANKILDAAGRINGYLSKDTTNWDDPDMRASAIDAITAQVAEIFLACSFQDLTSQRIRETLENLRNIEERLSSTLDKIGIHVDPEEAAETAAPKAVAQSQDDIDALFETADTASGGE